MRDVLIVGAGPAGLIAGAEAARLGADVEVVEEDGEVGQPDHCAGLVSAKGLRLLTESDASVIGSIRGVKIFSPSGKKYLASGGGLKAVVIDRPVFDREMLRLAESVGVKVTLNTSYSTEMKRRILINAEGVKARVGRDLGMETPKSIPAVQMDVESRQFEYDTVELHTGEWAPGFFAWVVPRREVVRVGLASNKGVPLELLQRMLEKNEYFRKRLGGARISKILFGKVVVGGPLKRCVCGSTVSIGDAGGFVKSTTGGGVVLGGLTAKMAGRAAARAALNGEPLNNFEVGWKKAYGGEFRMMGLAAKIYSNMRPAEVERALEAMEDADLLRDLMSGYDMDLQGATIGRVMRSGLFIHTVLPLIRSIFWE